MPSCSVLFCDKKTKTDKNRRIFNLPKDPELVKKWKDILEPYLKNTITPNIRICHLHFDPKDIETTFCHNVEGRQVIIERERARLLPNAVPDRNFPTEEELEQKRVGSVRGRRPKDKKSLNVTPLNMEDDKSMSTVESLDESAKCEIASVFDIIYGFKESNLPNSLWAIHRCPDKTKVVFSYLDFNKMSATKLVRIDSDLTTTIYMDGQAVRAESLNLQQKDVLETITNIVDLIDQT